MKFWKVCNRRRLLRVLHLLGLFSPVINVLRKTIWTAKKGTGNRGAWNGRGLIFGRGHSRDAAPVASGILWPVLLDVVHERVWFILWTPNRANCENAKFAFLFSRELPTKRGCTLCNKPWTHTFFLLAPRLPHVVRGAKDTCESGCEVHDGRVGEECIGVEELSHDSRFFRRRTRTRTTSLSRLLKSTLFSWRKKPTSRPSRPFVKWYIPLTCSFSSKRSAEALFELAFPRRERCRG